MSGGDAMTDPATIEALWPDLPQDITLQLWREATDYARCLRALIDSRGPACPVP